MKRRRLEVESTDVQRWNSVILLESHLLGRLGLAEDRSNISKAVEALPISGASVSST